MSGIRNSGRRRGSREGAFTLVEIIVALTIIAVIAAIAIPVLKTVTARNALEDSANTLAEMVMATRQRAMKDRRAQQIIFERGGIHALEGNRSYADRQEFLKHLEELRKPPEVETIERVEPEVVTPDRIVNVREGENGKASAPPPPSGEKRKPKEREMPWTLSLTLEENTECEALFWGDGEPERLQGDQVRRWVFQPSGMASPVTVRFLTPDSYHEVSFDLMTGEVNRTRGGPRKKDGSE